MPMDTWDKARLTIDIINLIRAVHGLSKLWDKSKLKQKIKNIHFKFPEMGREKLTPNLDGEKLEEIKLNWLIRIRKSFYNKAYEMCDKASNELQKTKTPEEIENAKKELVKKLKNLRLIYYAQYGAGIGVFVIVTTLLALFIAQSKKRKRALEEEDDRPHYANRR